jgi:hypothetical protein
MIALFYIFQILFISNIVMLTFEEFPEIEDLEKDGDVEFYDPNNLYDYINGAADSYLNYDFESLNLQRYKGSNNQSLKIEIYKHSNAATGFGIYSSERPTDGNWLNIGSQGYFEKGILNFYKGRYYVKIMTYDIDDSKNLLINTANLIADKLDGGNEILSALELFPDSGKQINSEKYVHRNFMGYESLNKVFTAEYEIEGNYFELFFIEKENDKVCRAMLKEYFKSIEQDTSIINEGKILINDPYQGEIKTILKKNILIGAINYSDAKLAENHLELFLNNLKSHLR